MKEGRVIAVLLAVIVLLGVILGIKIMNNTPEKQMEEIANNQKVSNVTENKQNVTTQDETTEFINKYLKEIEENRRKNEMLEAKIQMYVNLFTTISIWVIIISSYIIFKKMGIDSELIKKTAILNMAMFLPLVGIIATIVWLVFYIRLLLRFGEEAEITTIMCFIPFVIPWKLGNYFGKGTMFKLGMTFLPMIFLPILAFTAEE